ncbi:MAG: SRPBCC family protein [Parvibaculaceae bacterium]
MNDLSAHDAYGVPTAPATLTFQRLLPGPVERVWAALIDSGLRRHWLAAGEMEMRLGAPFELVWRNDELSGPPGRRPAGFPEEFRMRSLITELAPPCRLSMTWDGTGDATFVLAPHGRKVLLSVIHRGLADRDTLLSIAAGWHMHLDILVIKARGEEPESFWDGWSRLRQEYDRRLAA